MECRETAGIEGPGTLYRRLNETPGFHEILHKEQLSFYKGLILCRQYRSLRWPSSCINVILHSPKEDYADREDPCREVALQVAREGLSPDFFGLLVGNDIRRLCILQYDYITVFIFGILA